MGASYPNDWDSRRKKVYKRDNYTCQNCGIQGGPYGNAELHAHHVVPKSKGGTHETDNLQTVCKECHKAIHGDSIAPTGRSNESGSSSNNFGENVLVATILAGVLQLVWFTTQWGILGFILGAVVAFLLSGVMAAALSSLDIDPPGY